ncbi:hypothetical protein [Marixanthomonas spongiae]|uniref:Uncharacterized protein n=1 Tax=Marixanthomonas spongiae TaxID=2174845 RepID=A0A2U0HW46_9FLAO|nr:hypothetical protein [Marixanthomonas spongiae]PVW13056.1 hypothetical protein DDV96_14130 [Marixanthomonas spongiae]
MRIDAAIYIVMKRLLLLLPLFITLFYSPIVSAQINLLEAIQENAEQGEYGEEYTAENQENPQELTEEQKEFMDKLKEMLEGERENLDEFNDWSSQMKCTYMMLAYVYNLEKLNEETEATADCKLKYDLYGMQLLAIASSTTILYCPEGMANATEQEMDDVSMELWVLFMTDYDVIEPNTSPIIKNIKKWVSQLFYGPFSEFNDVNGGNTVKGFIYYLTAHFHPEFVMGKTLEIGQKMEALGCGG